VISGILHPTVNRLDILRRRCVPTLFSTLPSNQKPRNCTPSSDFFRQQVQDNDWLIYRTHTVMMHMTNRNFLSSLEVAINKPSTIPNIATQGWTRNTNPFCPILGNQPRMSPLLTSMLKRLIARKEDGPRSISRVIDAAPKRLVLVQPSRR
jgi:hypothetical protein